ncbi:MAG: hypothetical protein WBA57_22940 [Elainellaceae cyanobacterium]
MANPFLGVRISPNLDQAIATRMEQTGQSRTDVVIAALESYLNMRPCHERLLSIEQKLTELEARTQQSDSARSQHKTSS